MILFIYSQNPEKEKFCLKINFIYATMMKGKEGRYKMRTIAFYNQKGGVGKTTSATVISRILAEKGKRVLIVDLDPQSNTSVLLGSVKTTDYIESLFLDVPAQGVADLSLEDVLLDTEGKVDVRSVIQHTRYPGLDLIPTFLTLSIAEGRLKDDVLSPQQFRLKNHFAAIQDEYDICVLDCSPSISIVNINGMAIADKVYVPMTPDAYAIAGAATVRKMLKTVSAYNPGLQLGGLFFTKWNGRKRVSQGTQGLIDRYLPSFLLPFNVPMCHYLEESTFSQDVTLPKSERAAIIYRQFAEYIVKSLEA